MSQLERNKFTIAENSIPITKTATNEISSSETFVEAFAKDSCASGDTIEAGRCAEGNKTLAEIPETNKSINRGGTIAGSYSHQDTDANSNHSDNLNHEDWEITSVSYEKLSEMTDQASTLNPQTVQETGLQIQSDHSTTESDDSSKVARNRMGESICISFNNQGACASRDQPAAVQHSTDVKYKSIQRTKSSEFVHNLLAEFIEANGASDVDENHNHNSNPATEEAHSIYQESTTGGIRCAKRSGCLNDSLDDTITLDTISNATQESSSESLATANTERLPYYDPETQIEFDNSSIADKIGHISQSELASDSLDNKILIQDAISNATSDFSIENLETATAEPSAHDEPKVDAVRPKLKCEHTSVSNAIAQARESIRYLSCPVDVQTAQAVPRACHHSYSINSLPPFPPSSARNSRATKRRQATDPIPRDVKRLTRTVSLNDVEVFVSGTLRARHPHLSLSTNTSLNVAMLLLDIVQRIGDESNHLVTMTDKPAVDSRVLQYAIKLCLERLKDEADVAAGKKYQWLF